MRTQGRYLKFRHVFPELFSPAVQARRGLLRFRWFLLQQLDFRPIWTIGAAAGLGGVLLTVSLFFLSGSMRPVVAAREVQRLEPLPVPVVPPPISVPQPTPPTQPTFQPVPPVSTTLLPYLSPGFQRLVMPYGWEDRRLSTAFSTPQSMQPVTPFSLNPRDGWVRSLFRTYPTSAPQAFVPYREPAGLRWNSITPDVRVSDVARSNLGIAAIARPIALIEKQMPPNFSGDRPLEYKLIVSNPTANPLPDVSVFEAIDVGRVTAANPPARVEPNGLSWKLNGLAPGERRELLVSVWTEGLTALSAATDVELADRISTVVLVEGQTEQPFFERTPTPSINTPTSSVPAVGLPAFPSAVELPPFPKLDSPPAAAPTPRPQPAPSLPAFPALPTTPAPARPQGRPILKLNAEPPSAVAVGEDSTTWYEIANIGDGPATDIVLRLNLAEGLLHHDGSLEVEFSLPRLEPGEKRRARLVTRATTHGVYGVNGELTSGDLRETSAIELFAPAAETAAGQAESKPTPESTAVGQCCTLVVRRAMAHR